MFLYLFINSSIKLKYYTMNEGDVASLHHMLHTVDCDEYLDMFVDNQITPDLFPSLDKNALKELGIIKVGDRLRIQVLVKLLNMEKIKSNLSIKMLTESIMNASNTVTNMKDKIESSEPTDQAPDQITVITPDGKSHVVEISNCFNSTAIKRKILSVALSKDAAVVEEWTLYYYESANKPRQVHDIEVTSVCTSSRQEKNRLILCHLNDPPTIDAINTSNKLVAQSKSRSNTNSIKNFMGQRPPSQMITTNLHDYFPSMNRKELRQVARNSVRVSIYGNQLLQQQLDNNIFTMSSNPRDSVLSSISGFSNLSSRMSMLSTTSFGVGIPIKLNNTIGDVLLSESNAEGTITEETLNYATGIVANTETENETETETETRTISSYKTTLETLEAGRPTSVIELLDDDDDEGDIFIDGNEVVQEEGVRSVLASERNNGPSVWHKGAKIGQGSFGFVYLGLNGLTGELMAVKQVDLPTSSGENSKTIMVNALKQEMTLLRELDHKNIVRYLGSSSDNSRLYIFLDYIPGGSVSSMLKMYGPFEEPLVRNFTKQVLIGLKYLHSKGIIHRDIKGANILIDIDGTVKISDFGISKKIDENALKAAMELDNDGDRLDKRASLQGSVYWMAPEVVKQIAYTDRADIWSVGCLIVEMFTGKHPYPTFSQMQAIFRIGMLTLPEFPNGCSEEGKEFLALTFDTDYKKRKDATALLKHPFTKSILGV